MRRLSTWKELSVQDEDEFATDDSVRDMVRHLESGKPLGPDPRYKGLEIESSESFQKRMLLYRQAYEAQSLPKKDWKVLICSLPVNSIQTMTI